MHRPCLHVHTSDRPLGLWTTLLSVLAAFFGVQSSHQRIRDVTHGHPWHYLIVGLLMTLLVSGLFWAAVKLALRYAA